MATRSDIIAHCADGKWRRVYCHSDGYLSHNGRILFAHYQSRERASALVSNGDMSVLGPSLEPTGPWGFDGPNAVYGSAPDYAEFPQFVGKCRFYRDRDEGRGLENWEHVKPREGDALGYVLNDDGSDANEYTYVFCEAPRGGFRWHVLVSGGVPWELADLGVALQSEAETENAG